MKKSGISILFILFCSTLWAYQPGFELRTIPRKTLNWGLDLDYAQSTGNFTSSGNSFDSLPAGYSFAMGGFNAFAYYEFNPKFSFFGRTRLAQVATSSPTEKRTNTNFSDFEIGFDSTFFKGPYFLIPEFRFVYPWSKIDFESDRAALSEGVMEVQSRLLSVVKKNPWFFSFWGGLNYRAEGRSPLLPYGVSTEYHFGKWRLGTELSGFSSVGFDKDSEDNQKRSQYFCKANGCSKKFGAINPSWIEAKVWIKKLFSPRALGYFEVDNTLTGQNYAQGFRATLGFQFFQNLRAPPSRKKPRRNPKQESSIPSLKNRSMTGLIKSCLNLSLKTQ